MPKTTKSKYHVRPDGTREASRIINGKRVTFYGKSDNEIERKMIAYKGEVERGRAFKDVAEEWKYVHFPTLAPNTLRGYRPALQRAIDHFETKSIKLIKAPDIKAFINDFARKGMAKKTVSTQLLILSLIFGYAVETGEIEYSPAAHISLPKNLPKTRREAAAPEDEKIVKQSADKWLLPFLIIYSGLRKGEALALTHGDIDYEKSEIKVTKSVYHIGDKPYIKDPKTEAGKRTVPLLEPLREQLLKSRGVGYIFSDDGGKTPLTNRRYITLWTQYMNETGVKATAHQLRHSYATMLFEYGIEVKVAQDLLGHSTTAMTQDIYTHLRDNIRKDTAQLLNNKIRENAV